MKKKSIATFAILCALSSSAFAWGEFDYGGNNGVQIYGILDMGLTLQKNRGETYSLKTTAGNTWGSRVGLKGSTPISGSTLAWFNLEAGLAPWEGASQDTSKIFHRQSLVGLAGDWGEIGLGRVAGLSSDTGRYCILTGYVGNSTGFVSTQNILSSFMVSDRYNNMVVYRSPEISNTQISVAFSNNMYGDDNGRWSKDSHYYGIGATYGQRALPLKLGMIVEAFDYPDSRHASYLINAGGTYNFGPVTVGLMYEYGSHSSMIPGIFNTDGYGLTFADESIGHDNTVEADFHAVSVGMGGMVAGGFASIQGTYGIGKLDKNNVNVRTLGDHKFDSWSVGVSYYYPLSKQTSVYANGSVAGYGKAFNDRKLSNGRSLDGYSVTTGIVHMF